MELAQGECPLAGGRIETHERAVPGLALWLELDQALVARDRPLSLAGTRETLCEPLENDAMDALDLGASALRPRGIRPLREEDATVGRFCRFEQGKASGRLALGEGAARTRKELGRVPCVLRRKLDSIGVAIGHEHRRGGPPRQLGFERPAQLVERHVEGAETSVRGERRPEPLQELLAVDRPTGAQKRGQERPRPLPTEGLNPDERVTPAHRKAAHADQAQGRAWAGGELWQGQPDRCLNIWVLVGQKALEHG
jgi:hypothetical protein